MGRGAQTSQRRYALDAATMVDVTRARGRAPRSDATVSVVVGRVVKHENRHGHVDGVAVAGVALHKKQPTARRRNDPCCGAGGQQNNRQRVDCQAVSPPPPHTNSTLTSGRALPRGRGLLATDAGGSGLRSVVADKKGGRRVVTRSAYSNPRRWWWAEAPMGTASASAGGNRVVRVSRSSTSNESRRNRAPSTVLLTRIELFFVSRHLSRMFQQCHSIGA